MSEEKPFWLIAIPDDMSCWDPLVASVSGQIWSVYVVNPNEATHCCEITPSYWLEYIDCFYEKGFDTDDPAQERERDALEETLRAAQSATENSCYVHCSHIKHVFNEKYKTKWGYYAIDSSPTRKFKVYGWIGEFENQEDAAEHWHCNPPFPPLVM